MSIVISLLLSFCSQCVESFTSASLVEFLHVSFQGGSPAPSLSWVRKGDSMVLDADITPAADKEGQTVSLLNIVPSKVK